MSIINNGNKKLYYINSNNKLSGTHSDFTYQIHVPRESKFNRICVLQCTIPKSYYLIEPGYNTFILEELAVQTTITIPIGNYNRKQFQAAVLSLLNTNTSQAWVYTISYPSSSGVQSGKFTFTVTGNSGNQPSFIFGVTLAAQFGFDKNTTNTFVGSTLTSTNIINLQREDSVYIHCDCCTNESDNILQEIFSLNSIDFGNIIYNNDNLEAYSKDLISNEKNVYHFWLTDEDGVPLDLNGMNIQITLLLYESNNVFEMLKNYLKYTLIKN
jgi:hypothetical protein